MATSQEAPRATRFDAVLFDRDGTLVRDVPYNGDPDMVEPIPGAVPAVERLRAAGYRLGVVSNQSGVARGLLSAADVDRVNQRVDELFGGFDTWQLCPHGPGDGCTCRKPRPGLIRAAARELGTDPERCVFIGDIGSDVAAAWAAGATGLLVPTEETRVAEVAAAPDVVTRLTDAVDWILARERLLRPPKPLAPEGRRVLAVRADSAGDVLLCGPAIRAVASRAESVTLLCGPRGRTAAALLPGVAEIIEWCVPWIDATPSSVDRVGVDSIVERLRGFDEAIVFTSFHQSPLPMALLLRMAGVPRVSAISEDYPGTLLDVRHQVPNGVPEAERALSLAAAAGYPAPPGDRDGLRTVLPRSQRQGYVVVHPGASVPARSCPPDVCADLVASLAKAGHEVLVTGGPDERALTAAVAGEYGQDRGGRTDLAGLAGLIAGAAAIVCANTGPAHLAAAVGTPVVSLFAPTVPFGQWQPYRVPTVRLGDPLAACRDTRAKDCPVVGHPCLASIDPAAVVTAVETLTAGGTA